ncbi:MAG TPA: cytochrome c oxidase assembly protein [Actinomycetes bacterium]|nr:cytochrome c oxidase assembly protein [Actinomycetes bacterium]
MVPAYSGPPALTWGRAFSTWHLDVVALILAVLLAAAYVAGVRAVRAGGHGRWPTGRSVLFGFGVALLVLTCCSSLGAYASVLAWVYAAQMALLLSAVPVLLALGQPVELAAEVSPRRTAAVLRFPLVRLLTFPPVAMALVVGVPFLVWFTGWYAASLENAWVRGLTHVVLVVVGFAFFWSLLEVEDSRRRLPWAAAAAIVFVETVLDAVPGIVVWLRSSVLAPGYWGTLARPWGRTPLADQRLGGLVFWGIGEVVGLPILLATVVGWMRADAAEARRIDAELDAQGL